MLYNLLDSEVVCVCISFLTHVLDMLLHALNRHWRFLELLWPLLFKDCLLGTKICCCMDTLPTTTLHLCKWPQQLSRRAMDNDSLVVNKKCKGRLSETSWDFEQLVWQQLLYSVSLNQMTSQWKFSVLLCYVGEFSISKLKLEEVISDSKQKSLRYGGLWL